MRKLSISVLLITLLTIMTSLISAQETDAEVALTISRTACFGTCPVYTVTVYQDGIVVYEGENHVEATGTQTTTIEPETVQALVTGFVDAGYFDWQDEYTEMLVSDMPSVITSVTYDGETKQINRYAGDANAPLALAYLETWLDEVLNTSMWTGVTPQTTYFTPTMTPVMTLERDACFGTCPVYNLVIYDDGTVVYTGIKYVEVTGVHISNIEADSIAFLAERMEITGYFNWQDEYTEYLITDQPTYTTSLTWNDQYKRIERYDGDPNAPIGLVRLEDEIDRLVNVSQWIGDSN